MFNILAYNKIPAEGLSWLPREKWQRGEQYPGRGIFEARDSRVQCAGRQR